MDISHMLVVTHHPRQVMGVEEGPDGKGILRHYNRGPRKGWRFHAHGWKGHARAKLAKSGRRYSQGQFHVSPTKGVMEPIEFTGPIPTIDFRTRSFKQGGPEAYREDI